MSVDEEDTVDRGHTSGKATAPTGRMLTADLVADVLATGWRARHEPRNQPDR